MNLNLVFIYPLGFKHHVEPQKLISKKIRKHPPARPLCDDDGGGGGGGADDDDDDGNGGRVLPDEIIVSSSKSVLFVFATLATRRSK